MIAIISCLLKNKLNYLYTTYNIEENELKENSKINNENHRKHLKVRQSEQIKTTKMEEKRKYTLLEEDSWWEQDVIEQSEVSDAGVVDAEENVVAENVVRAAAGTIAMKLLLEYFNSVAFMFIS